MTLTREVVEQECCICDIDLWSRWHLFLTSSTVSFSTHFLCFVCLFCFSCIHCIPRRSGKFWKKKRNKNDTKEYVYMERILHMIYIFPQNIRKHCHYFVSDSSLWALLFLKWAVIFVIIIRKGMHRIPMTSFERYSVILYNHFTFVVDYIGDENGSSWLFNRKERERQSRKQNGKVQDR